MTKTTSKARSTKTTDQAEATANQTTETMTQVTEAAQKASDTVTNYVSVATGSSRKVLEGIWEVDKALFGYAREAVQSYVDLGREAIAAKSVNDVLDLTVAHAHGRVETVAANTREVLDVAATAAKEAYAPISDMRAS